MNRYAYVRGNPLRYTDPTGHFSEDEIKEYFGVKSWDDVLALFDKGALAGRWGWLELMRRSNLGDVIAVDGKEYKFGTHTQNGLMLLPYQQCDGACWGQSSGSANGNDGFFWLEDVARSGQTYSLLHPTLDGQMKEIFSTSASRKFLHPQYDFGRVDKVALGLDTASAIVGLIPFASEGPLMLKATNGLNGASSALTGASGLYGLKKNNDGAAAALSVVGILAAPVPGGSTIPGVASIALDLYQGLYFTP